MSNEISVKVMTMGGEEKTIQTPTDMKVDDFIQELVIALHLPLQDAEGNPVSWRLDNKDTGRTLVGAQTLEENGVQNDHRLSLLRQTIAGAAAVAE